MGVFRVILALSVLLSHAGGITVPFRGGYLLYFINGGGVAVQCFYIISGFYMALILDGKYQKEKGGTYLFYTNRAFRLLPLYLVFLLLSFCLSYLSTISSSFPQQPTTDLLVQHDRLSLGSIIFLTFSNIFILGHDLMLFFVGISPSDGSLFLTTNIPATPRLGIETFFIPQSWTLSLEFYFYMIVPFVIRKTGVTILLVIASLLLRAFLYSIGHGPRFYYDFWVYGFFPNELALFLLGTLSYRIYTHLKDSPLLDSKVSVVAYALVLCLTLFYPWLPQKNTLPNFFNDAQLIYYTAVILGLPFIFKLTKTSRIDRMLGELSYPIYLCHLMIIPFFGPLYLPGKSLFEIISIILTTTLVSLCAILVIQKPVDKYRESRLQLSKGAA